MTARLHLLLPPSEAKRTGGRGAPLSARPADGALAAPRAATLDALSTLLAGDRDDAARALLLPAGIVDEALALDAAVRHAPTMPALHRYAGVVYDGLDVTSMSPSEVRLAARSVLIFTGLFGVLRADEPIPAYRVPGKAVLPGLGVASTFWRPALTEHLAGYLTAPGRRRGLIVDLRSADYAAMWRPPVGLAGRVVGVRVLSPAPRGGHAVISYTSKHAKGRLAAALIRRAAADQRVDSVADVAQAWAACGGAGCVPSERGVDLYTE